jgi:tetratricopeptide (TPR) repeat protein
MRTMKIICVAALLCFLWGSALPALAQQGRGRGRINGEVKDPAGRPLEGVSITAIHVETGTEFTAKTDDDGSWAIGGLGTGMFRITAELEGYTPAYMDLNVSQFSRKNPPVDFTLQQIEMQQLGVPALDDEASAALIEEGNQLFNDEKYQEAAAKYEEFLEKNPQIYRVYQNLGDCYKELGEYEKAVDAYRNMLEGARAAEPSADVTKETAASLAAMGETYIRMGELDTASDYLEKAMAVYPDDETFAFNVGEIYFKQGEAARGIELFNRAIELKPDWPPPYRQRGYAYLNLADYRSALESFNKFLELAPDSPQAPVIRNLIPQLEKMIKQSYP